MRVDPSKYRIIPRRTLFVLAAVLGLVGLALPSFLYVYFQRVNQRLAISGGELADLGNLGALPLQLAIYANAALFLAPALWLVWRATRSFRLGASPPPGAWVLENQLVHLGSRARLRALVLLAIGLCCLSVAGAWIALALTISRVAAQ